MTISIIDLFSIGIGPSSSHTVGPMRAANHFSSAHPELLEAKISVTLHGSLAATGVGHGTDRATILGLVGYEPTTTTPDIAPAFGEPVATEGTVTGPDGTVSYQLIFDPTPLPEHPNAMTFIAYDAEGNQLADPEVYFSVGGGFILTKQEFQAQQEPLGSEASTTSRVSSEDPLPYRFHTGDELLSVCKQSGLSVAEIMMANEIAIHGDAAPVIRHIDAVWEAMQECVVQGIKTPGILPGGLDVQRRAPELHEYLQRSIDNAHDDALHAMEWVNLYALAVNEENAAGGRIVTAPTNGAAGIIPAVMHYARDFRKDLSPHWHRDFLLSAAAVGVIIKLNASISGAEVGCQGEVGSASAMAAAGLCQVMGGTPEQVEHAGEIALEHNLGLTCDPVAGLVQIPCIERNAIGGVKSINAARLSLIETGPHRVKLDEVVKTMADTGRDMLTKYKETSMGGLAVNLGLPVNLTEC